MKHAKHAKRVLALVLTAAMSTSALSSLPAYADTVSYSEAAPSAYGNLSATLRFDYQQQMQEVLTRNIKATLYQMPSGRKIGDIPLDTATGSSGTVGGYDFTVTAKNVDGAPMNGETWIGYYDISVPNLPTGSYRLEFTGKGYTNHSTDTISLKGYSKHVILGTADGTFALGDIDDSGKVDSSDLDSLTESLGKTDENLLDLCDLSGDGKIDIVDLAYVNHQAGMTGAAQVLNTSAIVSPDVVDTTDITVAVGSDIADMFADNGKSVTLSSAGGEDLSIPINFAAPVEMEQIEITSPDSAGALQKGTAIVETEDGETIEVKFDNTAAPGFFAMSRKSGSTTVTINLGNRVPVKKITIKVEKVEGTEDFTVIEEIKFLQDIVPDNPVAPNTKVKKVSGQPGDKMATLKWSELPNVTGYRINYGLSGEPLKDILPTEKTSAVIEGLENLIEYEFIVTPVNGDWEGIPSDPITVTPQPAEVPMPPDFLSVTELDSALRLSWGKSKNATGYRVYYKEADASAFTQAGGDLTSLQYTYTGLKNDTNYHLCVTAFNEVGESPKSKLVEGTPKAVSYEEPEGIPKDGRMERSNLESIFLTDSSNYDKNQYPTDAFKTSNVADGDYKSHWTSQSLNNGAWWKDKTINFVFKDPMEMNNIVFVPRLDDTYRNNLRLYTITVWHEGENLKGPGTVVAKELKIRNTPSMTGFATLPFPLEGNIKKIAVKIEQEAYRAVSLSEIIFFNYDPTKDLANAITNLFADELHTRLADGVTADTINSLKTRLDKEESYYLNVKTMRDELALAEALLDALIANVAGSRMIDGIESRDGNAPGNSGQGGSTLQPLGVAAFPENEITVYASGIPEGASVQLMASQHYAEASTWLKGLGKLENGRNIFIIPKIGNGVAPRGGSLYLTYAGKNPDQIKLHIRRSTKTPLLQLSDWDQLSEESRKARIGAYVDDLTAYIPTIPNSNIENRPVNSTEISMPHVLLSIPATQVNKVLASDRDESIQNLYNNVLAWEQLMEIACKVQGIDDNSQMQVRQNIRYMQMFAGAFMYAAGSHIGIGYGSCTGVVSGRPTDENTPGSDGNGLFGWGIGHEVGHNMDKLGKAEITNNIYSIILETYDGKENTLRSRLEDGMYTPIFEKTAAAYPGASNDVFVQLGMYWQLHLAYDDGANPLDFYNRFFKEWKAGGINGAYSYDEKVAVTASKIANRDLSDFFYRWGMRLGEDARAEMTALPKEDRALWYLNDESRRYRLAGKPAGSGETTASAVMDADNEKQVNLIFSSTADQDTIQGFDIQRDGKSVAFVTSGDKYKDIIGSANNRTFRYTVQAYDKLGNAVGAPADAGEVRVAYDKTIDPNEYELTRADDGTITAVFKESMAVSGIKVENVGDTGTYQVTVKNTSDAAFVVAKDGDFSKNEAASNKDYYVSYFNKPGAPASDTRIWTYDAEVITLSDIPADAQVSFISYAGDNIAFGEDVIMGRLKNDYSYGTTDGIETIKAGTLVVTGSYRGDPIFNLINLEGEYTSYKIDEKGEQSPTSVQRVMPGEILMFAEIPADGEVSDISDGFFLFVPDLQNEAELQPGESHCDAESLLPARIRAVLYRTDDPYDPENKRETSTTLWIGTPSADSLPEIIFEGVSE